MTRPGKGWAKRVTRDTLDKFRTLLRTGTERAVETPLSEEVDSDIFLQDSTESSNPGVSRDTLNEPTRLFSGSSIRVPSEFRSRPKGNRANPVTASRGVTRQRTPSTTPASSRVPGSTTRRWFKRMSSADAQRPLGSNTNPTGHLTLVRSRHPIEQATWFRRDLFANEDWQPFGPASGQREQAMVNFHVQIEGEDLGHVTLEVRFTPRFESSQGNRTTVVHWGSTIGDRLRQNNYTDYYVTIERTTSGTFLMVIDRSPTGPFIG